MLHGREAPGPGEQEDDPHPWLSDPPPHLAAPAGGAAGGQGLSPVSVSSSVLSGLNSHQYLLSIFFQYPLNTFCIDLRRFDTAVI